MSKIAMVVHNYYLRDARVRRYAEALAEEGYVVDVFCLQDKDESSSPERCLGVNIFRVPLSRNRGGRLSYIVEYLKSFWLLTLLLTRHHFRKHYDIVHIHNMPDFLVFTAIIPRLTGAYVILDLHDPTPQLHMSKYGLENPSFTTRILFIIERVSTSFANFVITATEMFKEIFVGRGIPPEKIMVIVNAADPNIFDPSLRSTRPNITGNGQFNLLYIGTVAERYGLDIVVRGLHLLEEDIPGIHLDILCKIKEEGTGLEQLMQLVHKLKLQDRVTLHNPIPLEQVPMRILQADAGVYTPYADIHMNMALSLKIPEFVAMGVPLIASRIRVLEYYFGPSAMLLFPPGDEKAFAQHVLRLYQGKVNVKELIAQADEFLERYSWSNERSRYLQLIETVLTRRH